LITVQSARYDERWWCGKETSMLEVAIMIEGQDGTSWRRWCRLARVAEDLDFSGLYRSDHFTNPTDPYFDAIELWASLTWLADNTSRIKFGPLVSPVSFRHPVVPAWTAAAVDDLSGGRLRLGLGAGWQKREHRTYDFELLDTDRRCARSRRASRLYPGSCAAHSPSRSTASSSDRAMPR
jgi:alkanesulfonate monooxygenase SsuD/methylene tetrahydromethanopterin reductase-like flavin-dependent oxidoreductase (luciferase family)